MPNIGDFYSRYAKVYYLLLASQAFADDEVDLEKKKEIKETFSDLPAYETVMIIGTYDSATSRVKPTTFSFE